MIEIVGEQSFQLGHIPILGVVTTIFLIIIFHLAEPSNGWLTIKGKKFA